ncbi:Alpha-glucosidase [Orbilia brochopaga]|nr:Alpha-glucosidase [Drechslerella brochopaga]
MASNDEKPASDTVDKEHSILPDDDAPHGCYEYLEPETQELPPDKTLPADRFHTKSAFFALLKDEKSRTTKYGETVKMLKLEVTEFTKAIARIRITDLKKQRWEIPQELVPIGDDRPPDISEDEPKTWKAEICLDPGNVGFFIYRKPDLVPIFDARGCSISYYDHYLEISTKLPEDTYIFGLGEVTGPFLREPGSRYAFWARDAQTPLHENAYSSLPMFLAWHKGTAFGVYLHNSNAMDMVYTEGKMTWKVVGGILDFYVYTGPTYEAVIRQHQHVVGFPRVPPYWTLGYHQCRWYYDTTDKLHESRERHILAEIPVDAFWLDIDYMIKYRLFTLDPNRYPNFAHYVNNHMRPHHHKLVAIMDPGVKNNLPCYEPWARGVELDIFIKNGNSREPRDFVGKVGFEGPTKLLARGIADRMDLYIKVWPGHVVFPDWTHPNIKEYWDEMFEQWLEVMPVDGIWHGANPPYSVNHGGKDLPLNNRSIAVESVHHDGVREYELHNLFGHLNCKTTYETLTRLRPHRRPFILTRSAFAGTGRYASKWLGDNFSTWDSMRWSISGILNMQIFGIPHIGADIGGFSKAPSEELLIRWLQLGSMYPFCRNHNMPNTPSQEAHISDAVSDVARRYLNLRYRLLPFWYTQFANIANIGGSVIQPVWAVHQPKEADAPRVLHEGNDAFLVGKSLLVVPVLKEGATTVRTWIPKGVWYDILNGETIASQEDQWLDLAAPINRMPVYVCGGTIIPMHYRRHGRTTEAFRAGGLSLLIALDEKGRAQGTLCLDDGVTIGCRQSWIKLDATLDKEGKKVNLEVIGQFLYDQEETWYEITVREVVIMGVTTHTDLKLIQKHIVLCASAEHTIDF